MFAQVIFIEQYSYTLVKKEFYQIAMLCAFLFDNMCDQLGKSSNTDCFAVGRGS
jgi:hypothetical protein